ncbi:hypothetical protein [Streptomyces sp. NPDC008125]|uniref:hypothetical protein n=1 Tax=Streptomyces sp. NPDC008125 TaxID=3364811 RepID=UPI0036E396C3
MSDAALQLGEMLARAMATGSGGGIASAQVIDLTDLGGVNVSLGGATVYDVPCPDSYRSRKVGDWVAVRTGAKPVVMWRLGEDPGETDHDTIRELADEVAHDVQIVRAATWGTAAPSGTGWQQTTVPFVRKVDGKVELYFQLASITDPSPTVPPSRPPNPVTVTPDSSGSWRGGRPDNYRDHPYQGDYTGGGALRGGWFYGSKIAAACAGKTVASMVVTFTRQRGSGANAKRPMHLYLHSYTSPPAGQLNLGDGPEDLLQLSVGAQGTAKLPAAWCTALASGSARGLAIYATGSTDYAAFGGGSIKITFS